MGLLTQLIRPANTAVVAGERASLHCASNSSTLSWASTPTNLPPYTILVSQCRLNPDYTHLYGLDIVGPYSCDLVLLNATASQAIMHHCIEADGFEGAQSAMIAVLGELSIDYPNHG